MRIKDDNEIKNILKNHKQAVRIYCGGKKEV